MNPGKVIFRRACINDVEDILDLQHENQINVGGTLSASLPSSLISEMIREMPVVVALCDNRLVGYLIISTPRMNSGIPIVVEMLKAHPADDNTLINGPICVSTRMRGQGIAQGLYVELRRINPGHDYLCFIRADNDASIRAHLKIGMTEVGRFTFNHTDHIVFSYKP